MQQFSPSLFSSLLGAAACFEWWEAAVFCLIPSCSGVELSSLCSCLPLFVSICVFVRRPEGRIQQGNKASSASSPGVPAHLSSTGSLFPPEICSLDTQVPHFTMVRTLLTWRVAIQSLAYNWTFTPFKDYCVFWIFMKDTCRQLKTKKCSSSVWTKIRRFTVCHSWIRYLICLWLKIFPHWNKRIQKPAWLTVMPILYVWYITASRSNRT